MLLDPARDVLVTAGATEALAATLLALIDGPDDEVVVFEPYYDSYAAVVALAGARLVTVPLRWPDFQPDLDELRRAVTRPHARHPRERSAQPDRARSSPPRCAKRSCASPSATMRPSSPTRSTSTSSSTSPTCRSRRCPGRGSAR